MDCKRQSVDGVLGIWTRDRRMEGAYESTELWRPHTTPYFDNDVLDGYLYLQFECIRDSSKWALKWCHSVVIDDTVSFRNLSFYSDDRSLCPVYVQSDFLLKLEREDQTIPMLVHTLNLGRSIFTKMSRNLLLVFLNQFRIQDGSSLCVLPQRVLCFDDLWGMQKKSILFCQLPGTKT